MEHNVLFFQNQLRFAPYCERIVYNNIIEGNRNGDEYRRIPEINTESDFLTSNDRRNVTLRTALRSISTTADIWRCQIVVWVSMQPEGSSCVRCYMTASWSECITCVERSDERRDIYRTYFHWS